ncbi:MAG: LPS export ABC transporter periplasmic protein LptC [Flavobacteriales bacterium]
MRRPWRTISSSIPALLAGMLFSCSNDLDQVAAVAVADDAPDRITTRTEQLYTEQGRPRYRLTAGEIREWAREPQRTLLEEGVRLEFFDSVGGPGSVLTSRRGVIMHQARRMEAIGEVVFVNSKGERLETEMIIWYQDSARIYTDKAVRIQRGDDIIHGQGLVAAEDFSRYQVQHVTGTLQMAVSDTLATE